jgi:hypothetical protein
MSRGPGVLQRRVLETLGHYQRHGRPQPSRHDDPWHLRIATRYWDAPSTAFLSEANIADFNAGRLVPVRVLTRDLVCTRCDLSRALKALETRGLVVRYASSMSACCTARWYEPQSCKYVGLSAAGDAWVNCQQHSSEEVGTYQPMPESRAPA